MSSDSADVEDFETKKKRRMSVQEIEALRTLTLTRMVGVAVVVYSLCLVIVSCLIMYSIAHVQPEPPTLADVTTDRVTRADLLNLLKRSVKSLGTCTPTISESQTLSEPFEMQVYWSGEHADAGGNAGVGWQWNYDSSGEGDDDAVVPLYTANGYSGQMTILRPAGCVADPGVPDWFSSDFITGGTEEGQFHPNLHQLMLLDNGCYAKMEMTGVGEADENLAVGVWVIANTCEDDSWDWLEETPVIMTYSFGPGPNGNYDPSTGTFQYYTFVDDESIDDCLPTPMGFTGLQVLSLQD